MKTQFLTALALGAALLTARPALAYDHHGKDGGGGGGHAQVARASGGSNSFAIARGGIARSPAAFRSSGNRSFANVRSNGGNRSFSSFRGNNSGNFAAVSRNRTFSNAGNFVSRGNRSFRSTPSVAFGGRTNASRAFSSGRSGRTFAFTSHDGWSRDRQYNWHGHHYRYYNNAWFVIDPYPYYYSYNSYDPGYYSYNDYSSDYDSGSVSVQVQQALANAGYYNGPVDGIVGPGTRGAIAAYQRDNGLPVTGTITASLLDSLNQG